MRAALHKVALHDNLLGIDRLGGDTVNITLGLRIRARHGVLKWRGRWVGDIRARRWDLARGLGETGECDGWAGRGLGNGSVGAQFLQANPSIIKRVNPRITFGRVFRLNIIRSHGCDNGKRISVLLEFARRDRMNIVEIHEPKQLVLLFVLVQPKLGGSQNKPAFLPGLRTKAWAQPGR